MVGANYIAKLAAKERKKLLRRCALKTPYPMEVGGVDEEEGPSKPERKESLDIYFGNEHDFGLKDPIEPDQALTSTEDQVVELTTRVRALEKKLEANTNILQANTRELAESTLQVSKLTALLQLFLKGKAKDDKDVAAEVSFPISDEKALAAFESKINPTTKVAYIQTITDLLKYRTLTKSIKNVLAEHFICDFNIDGVNGKKSLRTFPEFFSVLIDSINMLGVQQPPEKALAHALTCVKNNAHKKRYTQNRKDKYK